MATTKTTKNAQTRERNLLDSATLTSGSEQVIDFLLPVFAGSVLGLSPWQTGLLVGMSELLAFVTRPLSGVLVDKYPRPFLAAGGAFGLAVACVLYAFSTGLGMALGAAALAGASGAFLWVALRAMVAERLHDDSSVFAKLLGAEETGGWLVFVPALLVAIYADYLFAFLLLALCSLVAAALILTAQSISTPPAVTQQTPPAASASRPYPMLAAVAITMAAEAALGLLLLLHLQHHFELGLIEIAYVFLPGAIAMSLLPRYLHTLVIRWGRRRSLMIASVLSTAFAVGLACANSPVMIAALWVLSAVAWSILLPVQQAVVAEAAPGHRLGRALGNYEAATMLGAFVGSFAAGVLYDQGSWLVGCLVVGVVIGSGVFLFPWALKQLGASDRVTVQATAHTATTSSPAAPAQPDAEDNVTKEEAKGRTRLVKEFLQHTLLFWAVTSVAFLFSPSQDLAGLLGIGEHPLKIWTSVRGAFADALDLGLMGSAALRLWALLYLIDFVWTGYKVLTTRK